MQKRVVVNIFFSFIFLFSAACTCYSAFEEKETGVRPSSLGGAFTAVADDVNAIYWNPAGLSLSEGIEVMGMGTRLFGMEDLNYYVLSTVVPLGRRIGLGTSYSQFGFCDYKETQVIVSSGLKLHENMRIGANLRILNLVLNQGKRKIDHGCGYTAALDIGCLAIVTNKLRVGSMVTNLNSPRLSRQGESLAQTARIGVSYKPHPSYRFSADLNLPTSTVFIQPQIRAGVEVDLNKNFFVRWGMQSDPARFACGFGFQRRRFKLDYGLLTHTFLGSEHQFSASFGFGRQE